jgi:hypothetical protein
MTQTNVGTVTATLPPGIRTSLWEEAQRIDAAVEEAYWRTHFSGEKYGEREAAYATYQPAFRAGYIGRNRYPGKTFEEVEKDLQRDYDRLKGSATLPWARARFAVLDAWNRPVQTAASAPMGASR